MASLTLADAEANEISLKEISRDGEGWLNLRSLVFSDTPSSRGMG